MSANPISGADRDDGRRSGAEPPPGILVGHRPPWKSPAPSGPSSTSRLSSRCGWLIFRDAGRWIYVGARPTDVRNQSAFFLRDPLPHSTSSKTRSRQWPSVLVVPAAGPPRSVLRRRRLSVASASRAQVPESGRPPARTDGRTADQDVPMAGRRGLHHRHRYRAGPPRFNHCSWRRSPTRRRTHRLSGRRRSATAA